MMKQKEFFDRHAPVWDEKCCRHDASKIMFLLKKTGIGKGDRVLDAGCGTGVLFPFLKEITAGAKHIASLDISRGMLNMSCRKHGREFLCAQGDAHSTPFKKGIFSAVICFSCFPHFTDKEKACQEFHRLLSADGKLFIMHSESRMAINSLHRSIEDVVSSHRFPGTIEMEALLNRSSFKDISIIDDDKYYFLSAKKQLR